MRVVCPDGGRTKSNVAPESLPVCYGDRQVRQESMWTIMFADDIIIFSGNRDQIEENLEMWR